MGMCKPSGGINPPIFGKVGQNIKGSKGLPNTRTDMYDIDNQTELIQQRWYGPDGRNFWDWAKPNPRLNYKGNNGERTNSKFC